VPSLPSAALACPFAALLLQRTGAGEAEAAATAQPSCFPRFNSLQAFKDYMEGKGAKSAAAATKTGAAMLAAAAAACLLL
jgi:hypothetical protein